jgi:hypothetical protein
MLEPHLGISILDRGDGVVMILARMASHICSEAIWPGVSGDTQRLNQDGRPMRIC